jgi:class 3 adenylate cyclase/tetratricopeptide (TPR) repeat protein
MVCPECATANPDEARFCLHCGSRLSQDVPPESESSLPRGMIAKLEAARVGRSMEGERRIVTMLFCDVVGSTAMAERLDPEEWTEIMNEVYEHLIAPIYRYEGTLARLMGDAIFAFFGAPIAHEDDPQRAVSAALEIVDGMGAFREKIRAERDLDLSVRVGINTGPVVVGEVGSDLRVEYTAMGDAVNVAARMEQTAEPGTVQITDDTYRLVDAFFDVESRGAVQVKGKAEPVAAHRVLGRNARPGTGRGPGSGAAPLVGRDDEMETLRRAVDEALDGRGQMVALIGEAGLGKSRLIEETRAYWWTRQPGVAFADAHIRRMSEAWQCVSYDTTRPYAQYRRMLSTIAQIADSDPPEVIRAKLARTVEAEAPEWLEPHMRVWRPLFGVPEPGEDPLEGEAFRAAIMELVPQSTRQFGADPRLLVFEDLHWCDEASMDLLIETARVVDDLPSLMLFAFRPDQQAPSWRLKQWLDTEYPHRSTEIFLSPLSAEDSGALIDELLPERDRSDAVRAGILDRTEGNPLFLEELTAAVRDGGPHGAIPDTLQALITARLDTLEEDARRTLQFASVIGRSFTEPVLGAVAGDGAELPGRLRELERAGLIRETGRSPERDYAFHHSLTQEAAYGTILRRDRRALHLRVGAALEGLYANRLEEFAPVLAHHFREAGDDEGTLRYARLGGDHAARLYANAEAAAHYGDAIEAARRLGAYDELFGHLYPSRGRALELAGRFDEAEENYQEMRAQAEEADNRAAELEAAMSLTTLYATPTPKFDVADGRLAAQQTVHLARELDDRKAESKALWNLMNLNVFGGGDNREATEAGERSLAFARQIDAREQIAFTLSDLWRPYAAMGDLTAARESLEEARPIWRDLDNLPMLSENLASSSSLNRFAGNDDEALALAEQARALAETIGNPWGQSYALMNVFGIHLDRGEIGAAIATMRESIELSERAGFVAPQATTRATLAVTYAYLGDLDRSRDVARIALDVATQRLPSARPWVLGANAEIHLMAGELDEADAALAESKVELLPEPLKSAASLRLPLVQGRVAVARGDHARAVEIAEAVLDRLSRDRIQPFAPEALLLKGTALAAADRTPEAKLALREARSKAQWLGHQRILWEILAELGRIGDEDESGEMRAEARRIVERIADDVEDDLRASFVARPEVRAVLS